MERSFYYRVVAYSLITVLSVVALAPSVADWTRRSDKLPDWFKKAFTRKIALGLVSPDNQIVAQRRIPTDAELGAPSVVERIAHAVRELERELPGGGRAGARCTVPSRWSPNGSSLVVTAPPAVAAPAAARRALAAAGKALA